MSDMRVYIANLGKYTEGELVGAWFTPPIDFDNVKEQIGLNSEYEEYAIHDYELPFEIGEYTSIDEINRICALIQEIEGTPIYTELKALQGYFFSDLEELVENADDIKHYNCDSMEDLARQFVEEGHLGEVPESLQYYIDYEAYGRDLEITRNMLVTSNGIFEYCS